MTALVGPLAMVCGVLAAAGAAKIAAPEPTRRAIAALGAGVPRWVVRLLGAAEICLAAAAVAIGGVVAPLAVSALHFAFAVVVVALLRRDDAASCGCFGSADTPASGLHVAMNVISAVVAAAAVGAPGLREVLADQPVAGVPYLAMVLAGTAAGITILVGLPRLSADQASQPATFTLRTSR